MFSGMQQTHTDMLDNEIWTISYNRLDRAQKVCMYNVTNILILIVILILKSQAKIPGS